MRELIVPERCGRAGHVLTPKTAHIATRGVEPLYWECIVCLRVALYLAHYGPEAQVPAHVIAEDAFVVQMNASITRGHLVGWTDNVRFESGRQFA